MENEVYEYKRDEVIFYEGKNEPWMYGIEAGRVGAGHVVFHSSCFPFLRGAYLDSWSDQCAAFYTQLAEEYGLKICVENSMDLDPTPLRMLMEKTKSHSVCV